MKIRSLLAPAVIFTIGLASGLAFNYLAAPAQADEVEWETLASDPQFRRAVIEVINSCLVDNSIIYCN